MKKVIGALAFAILWFAFLGSSAYAGGWAVVTLDLLPTRVVSNEPLTVGFTVRQHGRTPVPGLDARITATRADSNDVITVRAHDDGPAGHYTATLTFPSAGEWEWYIDAFGSQQPMPALTVEDSSARASQEPGERAANLFVDVSAETPVAFGLFAAAVVVVWWSIRRKRLSRRLVLASMCLMLAVAIVAFWQILDRPASSAGTSGRAQGSSAQIGHALFIAKGCIVCHQNNRARYSQRGLVAARIGPDLSKVQLPRDYLRTWLRDPSKVKPGTEMPTLGLSENEIDALVVFLLGEGAER